MPPLNHTMLSEQDKKDHSSNTKDFSLPIDDGESQSMPMPTSESTSMNTNNKKKNKVLFMNSLRKRVTRSRAEGNEKESGMSRMNSGNSATHKLKRRHLVEHHYKIDQENRALLPGVIVHDDDLARDIHDFFNLIFLLPIILLNCLNWDWDKLMTKPHFSNNNIAFRDCWTGEYFELFFYTTVSYFIIDLIWILVVPKAVKSPSTIIQHHIASLLYLSIPNTMPSLRFMMGVCMSVEVNTWFLIARRVFNKQGFSPWTIDLPYLFSVRIKLISVCFYVSWISIRCILYPFVLVIFYRLLTIQELSEREQKMLMVSACLHLVFCALNMRWTMDLMNSKIRQWRNKSKSLQTGL